MKILILTDSLGLPRNRPEKCEFEETWPILLKNESRQIHQVSIGAATSQVLLRQTTYQKGFNPDIVFLQVGVVDCAPRFMSNKELDFTGALGAFGKSIRFLFNRKWIRKIRKISYINEVEFKKNMLEINNAFACPTVAIGILPASLQYEKILPGIIEKSFTYNKILEETMAHYIKSEGVADVDGVMSDFHHLNKNGHYYIFKKIEEFLSKLEIRNV